MGSTVLTPTPWDIGEGVMASAAVLGEEAAAAALGEEAAMASVLGWARRRWRRRWAGRGRK